MHYIIHAFDDPVHAPLALQAAKVYAEIVPAVSHAVHMPTHIFIQHGMWNEVAYQNVRAFNVARDLFKPGDSPGDMAHSGDWGHYGFLQLGEYDRARERTRFFEELAAGNRPRVNGVIALTKARYILETEEWTVQPVADDASNETVLANGVSAVRTGDTATAEKMLALLEKKASAAPGAAGAGGAHADHGAAPAPTAAAQGARPMPAMNEGNADAGKAVRIMHKELAALVAEAKGQRDQAITLLREAVQIEESMRPPNGAADPVKPSHELLGEVLLRAGKAEDAAAHVRRHACSVCRTAPVPCTARPLAYAAAGQARARGRAVGHAAVVLEGQGVHPARHGRPIAHGPRAGRAVGLRSAAAFATALRRHCRHATQDRPEEEWLEEAAVCLARPGLFANGRREDDVFVVPASVPVRPLEWWPRERRLSAAVRIAGRRETRPVTGHRDMKRQVLRIEDMAGEQRRRVGVPKEDVRLESMIDVIEGDGVDLVFVRGTGRWAYRSVLSHGRAAALRRRIAHRRSLVPSPRLEPARSMPGRRPPDRARAHQRRTDRTRSSPTFRIATGLRPPQSFV